MEFEMILSVDKNFAIGHKGDMLVYIKEDLHRFKEFTYGNIIIMGRKTFISLPGEKALPGRVNIVISRDENFKRDGVFVVKNLEELDEVLKKYENRTSYVIGGGEIVRLLIDRIKLAHLTMIDKFYENYDTTIPNLLEDKNWKMVYESEDKFQDDIKYKYVTFKRIG